MRADEIVHVDVVADAGAVGRVVVGAEDGDVVALPVAASSATFRMCVAPRVDCPARPIGIGAGDVEIAERHGAEPVGGARCR